jgi:hypothetical protein
MRTRENNLADARNAGSFCGQRDLSILVKVWQWNVKPQEEKRLFARTSMGVWHFVTMKIEESRNARYGGHSIYGLWSREEQMQRVWRVYAM